MSYRNLAVGFSGKNKNSQTRLSYSRYNVNGLDKHTVLEGSGLECKKSSFSTSSTPSSKASVSQSNRKNKTRFPTTCSTENDLENWKEKCSILQRKVQSLKKDLEIKETVINELKSQKQTQLDSHDQELNNLLEEQKRNLKIIESESNKKLQTLSTEKTKLEKNLENLQGEMASLKILHTETLSTMTKTHKKDISLLEDDYKNQITQTKQTYDDVIKVKDATIENLKDKVANSFNDSSRERQAQIDELVKELRRVSDEAEYVKTALRKFKSSNQDECNRCHLYQAKFKEASIELNKKEQICKDLFLVCSKMESQLSQKDDLLKIWNTVKSHI